MKYGLIAGNGRFPFLVLEGARDRGVEIVVAAIKEEAAPEIDQQGAQLEWMGVGQLGRLIRYFKRQASHSRHNGRAGETPSDIPVERPSRFVEWCRLLARLSNKEYRQSDRRGRG